MGLLLLIPGIILLATSGWFHDQHTVGGILTGAGIGLLLIQIILAVVVVSSVNKSRDRFRF